MQPIPPALADHLSLEEATLAFVDVETTGLNAWAGDRVCEVAIVRCLGATEVGRLVTLVNPLRAISPGAFAVNGITAAMVADAPPFARVAPTVREALDGAVLVAHNTPFDLSFLARELGLAGQPLPSGLVLDTLALARRNFRFRSNSLGALASALGIRTPGHRALADALTTRDVLRRLVGELFPRGARLADIVRCQGGPVGWPAAPTRPRLPTELAEAVRSGQRLRIWYVAADGEETVRWVDPIDFTGWQDSVGMVAYCHLRHEQRTFRLDRIVRWEVGAPPIGK